MWIVTQWFLQRRAQRQLLQERKKHEAERQAQREKQDYQHGQTLRLILQRLQVDMDPLIASQTYNNNFCPLTRLPEELLLNMLNLLYGDDVTLYCLRWTSRIFLRLLYQQSGFWTMHIRVDSPCCLDHYKLLQLRLLLGKDGRCKTCRRWNSRQRYTIEPCTFKGSSQRENPIFLGCEYWWSQYSRPHCRVCDTDHDSCQFPMAYQTLPELQNPHPQMCQGHLGSVQLCEHVYIKWATIKAHIDAWRRHCGERGAYTGSDWKACLKSFSIECHNAAHNIRCMDSEAPSWPRARLGTTSDFWNYDYVILYLEWTPHGRLDSLMPTTDEKIPAAELRALFRKFRCLGPANTFYPLGASDTLPEMACFKRDFPIYYKTGEEKHVGHKSPPSSSLSSLPPGPSYQQELSDCCQSLQGFSRIGFNSRRLDISPHYISGASGYGISSQCLAVRYQKGILICQTTALNDPAVKLVPSDPWLHAMDTRTYPHQQARQFRPLCGDASCTNYFQRAKHHRACTGLEWSESR